MIEEASVLTGVESVPDADRQTVSAQSFIFNDHNLGYYKQSLQKGLELVRSTIAGKQQPFSGVLPHELAEDFRDINLDESFPHLEDALAEVEQLYLNDAVYFHHPNYVAHLNCPVVVPAILAELILTSINSSVDTWDQSAGGTFIEQKLIDWTCQKIGFGDQADGVFTSGGTQSNLMAMLLARDYACGQLTSDGGSNHENKHHGLPSDFRKLRIFTSEISHFSVQKAAAILGLGYDAVVPVPVDRYFKMDAQALRLEVEQCLEQGLKPMAIVATAGTTDFGSLDPLQEISSLCRQHNIWMHVDAAYGCGLLVSPKYRHWLDGIEQANSVTVDYHKSFFQPVSCSAFMVRNKKHLAPVTYYADYLNPLSQQQEGTPNLVNKSIQTTRRFDALKLWLTLRTMGSETLGRAFDQIIHLARQTYLLCLSEPNIEVIHQPKLSTLVFRYCPSIDMAEEKVDELNVQIRKALFRSGQAVVAGTKVKGRQYLKFTLLNPGTTVHDIQPILKRIKQQGEGLAEQMSGRFEEDISCAG